jgi:hypothetical protein
VHAGVETLVGIVMAFGGAVEGEHGRVELRMAQGALAAPGMHAGFEQMRGIRMPERISTLLIIRR